MILHVHCVASWIACSWHVCLQHDWDLWIYFSHARVRFQFPPTPRGQVAVSDSVAVVNIPKLELVLMMCFVCDPSRPAAGSSLMLANEVFTVDDRYWFKSGDGNNNHDNSNNNSDNNHRESVLTHLNLQTRVGGSTSPYCDPRLLLASWRKWRLWCSLVPLQPLHLVWIHVQLCESCVGNEWRVWQCAHKQRYQWTWGWGEWNRFWEWRQGLWLPWLVCRYECMY